MFTRVVSTLLFFLLIIGGAWFDTQSVARSLDYAPYLSGNIASFDNFTLYTPWASYGWQSERYCEVCGTAGVWQFGGLLLGALIGLAIQIKFGAIKALSSTYGSARWANPKEVVKSGLLDNGGVVLGISDDGRYLRHNGPEHIKVVAPTRSGKGVGIVVPTLLAWEHSAVVYDIKGELWELTSGARSEFGYCIYYNPTDPRSARFNPLFEVRKGANEVRDVQNIADMLVDPDGKGLQDHWARTAHSLLVGLILHCLYCEENKSLQGVCELLSDPRSSSDELFHRMLGTAHLSTGVHPVVGQVAREMLNKSENERSGVVSTALTFLTLYRDPVVARATGGSDFRLKDIVSSDRPVTLYLCVSPSDLSRLQSFTRLIINQLCRQLTEDHDEAKRRRRLLLLLDEFPSLGKMDVFETSLAYLAGYNVKALLVSQALGQLEKSYGAKNSILDNCHVRVFFTPGSFDTADVVSRSLGQATVSNTSQNLSGRRFGMMLNGKSITEQEVGRSLLTPSEVLEFDKDREIIFVAGHRPINARKLYYYSDPVLEARIVLAPDLGYPGSYPYGPVRSASGWELHGEPWHEKWRGMMTDDQREEGIATLRGSIVESGEDVVEAGGDTEENKARHGAL